jgi:Uri superfamily endonuclease
MGGDVITKGRTFHLEGGYYAYVGSCGNYCDKRVSRHLNREKERRHWHVDFLSELCEPLGVLVVNAEERNIASSLSSFPSVKDFGSSDDKLNRSHLFKVEPGEALKHIIALVEK